MDAELLGYDVGGGMPPKLPRRPMGAHLRAFARHFAPVLLTNGVLFGVLALAGHAWVYSAWVVAFFTTYGLFIRIRSLAEHACTERTDDPFRNTRTTRIGWLAALTVAPMNVGYHLEHHLLPTVPYFRLPAMSKLLLEKGAVREEQIAPGYLAVLRRVAGDA
jgi:fatty acid desaturase